MNETSDATVSVGGPRRTTVVYGKFFAILGVLAGLVMLFGTPLVLLLFHQGLGSGSTEWVETMPSWTAPTALCIGMGGGVVLALFSACCGLLVPSCVIREGDV